MAKSMMASPGKSAGSPMGKTAQAGLGGKANKVGGIRTPFTSAIAGKGGKLSGGRK